MNPLEIFKFSQQCFGKRSDEKKIATYESFWLYWECIVHIGISTPHFKIIPPIIRIPFYFVNPPHPPIILANRSSQIFLITRNATVKLSSVNIIHAKQQHNVGFFIWKFMVKFMPGSVYINKIHARQCLYMISLYCSEGFPHSFNFFVVSKGMLQV